MFLKDRIASTLADKCSKETIVKNLTSENLRLSNKLEMLESKERTAEVLKSELSNIES